MKKTLVTNINQRLIEYLERSSAPYLGALLEIRRGGLENIKKEGVPTVKSEDWKYIDISSLLTNSLATNKGGDSSSRTQGGEFALTGLEQGNVLVVDEGQICLKKSRLDKGIEVRNSAFELSEERKDCKDFIRNLNAASLVNSIDIIISESEATPLYIVHKLESAEPISSYRLSVQIENEGRNKIVEIFEANASESTIVSLCSRIIVGSRAHLETVRVQCSRKDFTTLLLDTSVEIEKEASFKNVNVSAGANPLIMEQLSCSLNGNQARADLYGLAIAGEQRVVCNHTKMLHNVANCYSNEVYKCVVDQSAKSVFKGTIVVAQDAQKTSAFQQNQNISLSSNGEVQSRPQLEIFADDVKCSHGCTIGKLNNDAIYYLKTRGIAESEARKLLIQAFFTDITKRVEDEALEHNLNRFLNNIL